MNKWVVDTCVIIDVLSGDGGLRPVDITDLRKEEDDLSNAAKQSFREYGIIVGTRKENTCQKG